EPIDWVTSVETSIGTVLSNTSQTASARLNTAAGVGVANGNSSRNASPTRRTSTTTDSPGRLEAIAPAGGAAGCWAGGSAIGGARAAPGGAVAPTPATFGGSGGSSLGSVTPGEAFGSGKEGRAKRWSLPLAAGSGGVAFGGADGPDAGDRKSTRLNSSHLGISYAVFCLKK